MALIAKFLVDTSAAARMSKPVVHERIGPLIASALVATCAPLDSEALYSARNRDDYEQIRERRRLAYEYLPTDDEHWQKAFEAQHRLALSGRHRAVGMNDLLIAVLAAEHRLVLLHYDADFDIAAEVIDFEARWVAERGSLDRSLGETQDQQVEGREEGIEDD